MLGAGTAAAPIDLHQLPSAVPEGRMPPVRNRSQATPPAAAAAAVGSSSGSAQSWRQRQQQAQEGSFEASDRWVAEQAAAVARGAPPGRIFQGLCFAFLLNRDGLQRPGYNLALNEQSIDAIFRIVDACCWVWMFPGAQACGHRS